jgi:hypothetical protein
MLCDYPHNYFLFSVDALRLFQYTIRAMNPKEAQEQPKNESQNPVEQISSGMKGLAVASMVSGYILGPLVLLGGIGWWLTSHYENRLFVIVGVASAFVISNVLIIRSTTRTLQHLKRR